jgi:hypothetical protein
MSVFGVRQAAIDYALFRYGDSRIGLRGPQKPLDRPYIACVGSTEVFGRYVATPFPVLLEDRIGMDCANLGVHNAGPGLFLQDPTVLGIIRRARAVVLHAMPSHYLSNPFYAVHPRRNDRFVKAHEPLKMLYPEVDFTEFHFTGHMLTCLAAISDSRFRTVAAALQDSWVDQMRRIAEALDVPVLLMWFATEPPETGINPEKPTTLVTMDMLDRLIPVVDGRIIVQPSPCAEQGKAVDMHFHPAEAQKAAALPGGLAHLEAAEAVAARLRALRLTTP